MRFEWIILGFGDGRQHGSVTLYDPVHACSCAQCGTQCAAGDPCAHVAGAGP
jgi:hypothetical protein